MNKYDEAIKWFEHRVGNILISDKCSAMEEIALEALQQASERENSQPLTIEQLKERVGKPVWVEHKTKGEAWLFIVNLSDRFIRLINVKGTEISLRLSELNNEFEIYDHEPKGV